jgi:hypothetical protein
MQVRRGERDVAERGTLNLPVSLRLPVDSAMPRSTVETASSPLLVAADVALAWVADEGFGAVAVDARSSVARAVEEEAFTVVFLVTEVRKVVGGIVHHARPWS